MSPHCGLVQCVRADRDDTHTHQGSPYFSMLFCCINAFRLGVIIMAAAPLVAPSLMSRSGEDQRNADISSSRPNGQASLSLSALLFSRSFSSLCCHCLLFSPVHHSLFHPIFPPHLFFLSPFICSLLLLFCL